MERILKQNKILRNFREKTQIGLDPLEWFYSISVSEVVLNVSAKLSCFNVRVIKNKNNKKIN